jgi:hypothetical protein
MIFMKEQRAREILQALVQGVDPLSGVELPGGTILQQVEILRALLVGIAAIEQMAVRAQRRAQLPDNVGRPWTEEEERQLTTAFTGGDSMPDIAIRHGRTLRAIEARLERLGLISAADRNTRGGFGSSTVEDADWPEPP